MTDAFDRIMGQAAQTPTDTLMQRGAVLNPPGNEDAYDRIQRHATEIDKREAGIRAGAIVNEGVDPGSLKQPGGMEDLGMRFDIGLSDTFEEKRAKFKDKFPGGDFLLSTPPNGSPEILFRKSPEEQFAKLDAPMLEKFEPLGDIADIAADMPSIALEAFIVRGGGIVSKLTRIFAGEEIGRNLKEGVEELRGFQKETLGEMQTRILAESAIGTAGAGATMAISGPLNFFRGASNIKIVPGATAAQRAAERLDLPPLLPTQITMSPILKKIGQQAAATTSQMKEYGQQQQRAMVATFADLRDQDLMKLLRSDLQNLDADARRQVIEGAKLSDKMFKDGGDAIQQGIKEFDELSQTIVNKAYQDARKIATPDFDITPAVTVADEIAARAQALGKDLPATVKEAIEQIKKFDPNEPPVELPSGRVIDATERLRAIRTSLWDLKTVPPGRLALLSPEEREAARQASELYGGITHVLKNPVNADENFTASWAKANGFAEKRFTTMEQVLLIKAQRVNTPMDLAREVAKPYKQQHLEILRQVMSPERYRQFQDAVKVDFIGENNINGLTKKLDSFDKPTLEMLFDPPDIVQLRRIGRDIDNINRIGLQKLTENQVRAGAIADELIAKKSTAASAELYRRASPGQRQTIKAAIVERVATSSVKILEGSKVVDQKVLAKELTELYKSGMVRFLGGRDLRTLRDLNRYAEFVPLKEDAGGSMQTAGLAAGAVRLRDEALKSIIHNAGIGRAMTSKWFQRFAVGKGREPSSHDLLRVIGAAVADIANSPELKELEAQPSQNAVGRQ